MAFGHRKGEGSKYSRLKDGQVKWSLSNVIAYQERGNSRYAECISLYAIWAPTQPYIQCISVEHGVGIFTILLRHVLNNDLSCDVGYEVAVLGETGETVLLTTA